MGLISLSLPQVGQPDSTEEPKIPSDLTIIQNVINGNLDDTNFASPNNAVRRLVLQATGSAAGSIASGVSAIETTPSLWAGDAGYSSQPQDFQVAAKTATARIRVAMLTNNTSPGVTFTFGLYQATGPGGGSGILTFGFSLVSGSTVAITPVANNVTAGTSAAFALPSSSAVYLLGKNLSGSTPAASAFFVTAQLYAYSA